MPSDFQPIAGCRCVGCGRESDKVALKKLGTYSRSFACLDCYLKYSNCGNCNHEKHGSDRHVIVLAKRWNPKGKCHCGCTDYRHGLEAEFDRQFAEHTGKAAEQLKCLRCGNYFSAMEESRLCRSCEQEWKNLQNA